MSFRRMFTVYRRDLAFHLRRPLFWFWLVLLVFLAWGLSSGRARIESGDSSVGGTKAFITSEFAVAQQLAILTPLIYGFFLAVAAGMTVINDDETGIEALVHATSLRPWEYVWGKFLAVMSAAFLVLAIHMGAMVLFGHGTPAGEFQEIRGPFHWSNYARPALVFCAPTLVFFGGLSFHVGERSRRPILVFILPLMVLMACLFVLWEFAPSWLDTRLDTLLMLIDPAAFRWLNETQLKVDRGAEFYNTAPVPLEGILIANRSLMLALGLGAVWLSQRHLAATLRGVSRRAERQWTRSESARTAARGRGEEATIPATRPLAILSMTSRRPGLMAASWHVFRAEVAELVSSPGLWLFTPLLILEALGPNIASVGAFDTPLLATPGTFAVRTLGPLTTMLCLILLFYTVESLGRDRHTRLAAISQATPARNGSVLIGKMLANGAIALVVLMLQLLTAVAWIAYQGKVEWRFWPFALVWGLLLIPTLLLWTAFIATLITVTRNRYATYAFALVTLIFTAYRFFSDQMNWVGNWPLWSTIEWSDISVLELDRSALVLNRVLAIGMAAVFTVLTVLLFPRREADPNGLVKRLRPTNLMRQGLWVLPVALVPMVAGAILWGRVDRGPEGESTKKRAKDYWRKNIATYDEWPLPDLTAVEIRVDLEPGRGRLSVEGVYDLLNNREKPITQIPLTAGPHWESPKWTLDGVEHKPENRSGLHVFRPGKPLAKGATCRIGFAFSGTFPDGISRNGGGAGQFILPSGVVLTSFGTSFAPVLGFSEGVGVDKDNRSEPKEYPDDFFEGLTESALGWRLPFKTRVTVTGPADFTLNSVGTRESDTVANGKRTTVWVSDHPVNFFNIVAGRWKESRGEGTVVHHHPSHPYNVPEMVTALNAARKYYSEWFRPFPWKELKLSEFPALATYAQGFPTDITFSEGIGFLTRDDPEASAAFVITAHESAHQWWGNMVVPGKGPGGNLLSEGTSHFSTLLLLEQVKGPRARMEFARRIEDRYAKTRSSDSERPMVKIDGSRDGDNTVTYDKMGWVVWMLMNHMGRDRLLEGIREFFETYESNPDHPVLQDFLAVLRPHAGDAEAFDAFARQWFHEVVVPEYQLSDAARRRDGNAWVVTATLKNHGTGVMPVEVAATRGDRFPAQGAKATPYQEARTTSTLGAGESRSVEIRCEFEPDQIVVDPDVNVLMLRRKAATAKL